MVSRRGLGAGGVLRRGPRQLWAVPARGFGWVLPLHLLVRLRRRKGALPRTARTTRAVAVVVAVLVCIGVGCCTPVLSQGNRSSGTLAALHVCTCGVGTRAGHGSSTFGSTGSQAPPAPAKGTAAAEKTVKSSSWHPQASPRTVKIWRVMEMLIVVGFLVMTHASI